MAWEINLRIDVFHHSSVEEGEALELLRAIKAQGDQLMATDQDIKDVIARIDVATTKQGASLQQEADTLQKISDSIDKLITGGVTAETLSSLQTQADKIQAISNSLDAQAAFSNAIAAKADNPVPLPPPPPTP